MASVYELANLSAMAYDPLKKRFQGWLRTNRHGDRNGKGFYAETYLNTSKREVALAIRGTDFRDKDWGDFYADLQIALGKVPYQLKAAKKAFLAENKSAMKNGEKIFLTGHSLGGGVAALLAAEEPIKPPVVTFNSPGMLRSHVTSNIFDLTRIPIPNIPSHIIGMIDKHNHYNYHDISKFLHIRASGDIVSRGTGAHIGKIEDIYVNEWGADKIFGASRHLAQHSIDNMVSCLRSHNRFHKDLHFSSTSITPKMMAG